MIFEVPTQISEDNGMDSDCSDETVASSTIEDDTKYETDVNVNNNCKLRDDGDKENLDPNADESKTGDLNGDDPTRQCNYNPMKHQRYCAIQ